MKKIDWKKYLNFFLTASFIYTVCNILPGRTEFATRSINGFLKCKDGRYARLPKITNSLNFASLNQYYELLENKNIENNISSISSFIYPYGSIMINKEFEVIPFPEKYNTAEIDKSWGGISYSLAQKIDWFVADKLFSIYSLPSNSRTYKFTLFKSDKITIPPYISNENGQLLRDELIIDLTHNNDKGETISLLVLQSKRKSNIRIRDASNTLYEGFINGLGVEFRDKYNYSYLSIPIRDIYLCPPNNGDIIIRNVYHLGIGVRNKFDEVKSKYIGLQVYEIKLHTKVDNSFETSLPSF